MKNRFLNIQDMVSEIGKETTSNTSEIGQGLND